MTGDDTHGDVLGVAVLAQTLECRHPIGTGHGQVERDEVGPIFLGLAQPFFAIRRFDDFGAGVLEERAEVDPHVFLVVHDQNSPASQLPPGSTSLSIVGHVVHLVGSVAESRYESQAHTGS